MLGRYDPLGPGYSQTIRTLNRLAGLNKENIKWWLSTQKIKVKDGNRNKPKKGDKKANTISDEFADRLASLIIASPYKVAKAILNEFYNCCIMGINPEGSPTFRRRMITGALPTHVFTLQERATDLSLRASASKHVEDKKTMDPKSVF